MLYVDLNVQKKLQLPWFIFSWSILAYFIIIIIFFRTTSSFILKNYDHLLDVWLLNS